MLGQQWEYCTVSRPLAPGAGGRAHITYYTLNGPNEVPLNRDEVDPTGEHDLYRLVAMMGRDGWEMVNALPGAIYFKRPTVMPTGKPINPDPDRNS